MENLTPREDQYLVFTNPIKKIDKMTCDDAPSAAIPTAPRLFSCIGVPSKMSVGEFNLAVIHAIDMRYVFFCGVDYEMYIRYCLSRREKNIGV